MEDLTSKLCRFTPDESLLAGVCLLAAGLQVAREMGNFESEWNKLGTLLLESPMSDQDCFALAGLFAQVVASKVARTGITKEDGEPILPHDVCEMLTGAAEQTKDEYIDGNLTRILQENDQNDRTRMESVTLQELQTIPEAKYCEPCESYNCKCQAA